MVVSSVAAGSDGSGRLWIADPAVRGAGDIGAAVTPLTPPSAPFTFIFEELPAEIKGKQLLKEPRRSTKIPVVRKLAGKIETFSIAVWDMA